MTLLPFTLCCHYPLSCLSSFFFFTDPATTQIYTLSLHDALPISLAGIAWRQRIQLEPQLPEEMLKQYVAVTLGELDRKSTRLNSSHTVISYAVFCLKKKKKQKVQHIDKKERNKKQEK